jgi:hypothetical protein
MSEAKASAPENVSGEKLPRRDWILLPLIALRTSCLIAPPSEWIARVFHWVKVRRNLVSTPPHTPSGAGLHSVTIYALCESK